RLRREKAAAEGNYPGDEEDEEAQVQRALDLSRAEAEFRRGVEQRGGAYERGGGSGSTRGNVMQRMFRRSTSQRESPVVEDYNLAAGGRRGITQPRIDTGSWTQKGKNANEAIGKAWSKFFHIAGVPGRQADSPYSLFEYIAYILGCTCSILVDDVRIKYSKTAVPCHEACFTMLFVQWMRAELEYFCLAAYKGSQSVVAQDLT